MLVSFHLALPSVIFIGSKDLILTMTKTMKTKALILVTKIVMKVKTVSTVKTVILVMKNPIMPLLCGVKQLHPCLKANVPQSNVPSVAKAGTKMILRMHNIVARTRQSTST